MDRDKHRRVERSAPRHRRRGLSAGQSRRGEIWHSWAKREKEAELLFIGNQYRRAITLCYDSTPGTAKRYPRTLEDLIKDPRQPSRRHPRRDSLSEDKPLKAAGFKVRDAAFDEAQKYADWKFIHTPAVQPATAKPAAAKR